MAIGAISNASIVYGNPRTADMEGTTPPLLADNNDNKIKEVDIP